MARNQHDADGHRQPAARAALFIDYDNLYTTFKEKFETGSDVHNTLTGLIEQCFAWVSGDKRQPTGPMTAMADFSTLGSDGTHAMTILAGRGIEPRFVSTASDPGAVEVALALDAALSPEYGVLVLLTGDRLYLPLLAALRNQGRNLMLGLLDSSRSEAAVPFVGESGLLDISRLMESKRSASEPSEPVIHTRITDSAALFALRIIEENFGQYDEVYLTPLLRKLSEVFNDELRDPKETVSTLEKAGAVWLEKRKGFPYDYTVLLVDAEHPDVQEIQEEYREEYLNFGGKQDSVLAGDHAGKGYDEAGRYHDSDWED